MSEGLQNDELTQTAVAWMAQCAKKPTLGYTITELEHRIKALEIQINRTENDKHRGDVPFCTCNHDDKFKQTHAPWCVHYD